MMAPKQKDTRDPLDETEFSAPPFSEVQSSRKQRAQLRKVLPEFMDMDTDEVEEEEFVLITEHPASKRQLTWKISGINYTYKQSSDRLTYNDPVEGFEIENDIFLQGHRAVMTKAVSRLKITLRAINRTRISLVTDKIQTEYDYAPEEDNPTVELVDTSPEAETRTG